jgi:hypothetical protein
MTTLAQMTLEDLKRLIAEVVAETLEVRAQQEEVWFADTRTWDEVKQDVERHRWTPPPGTPSVTEMLREDRDDK